ncbi:YidB family protein [uncultured Methylobacterium sp.]|uniref:YidB family protein n=1 Tax=uncultured Methylobacterium sp. TaxID=157278 RepID=UPI0035CAB9EE
MSDGFPSMTALLGLLALAGYQNRDKIAEMLGNAGQAGPSQAAPAPTRGPAPGPAAGQGLDLGRILGGVPATNAGGFLNNGLGEMLSRFTQAGHGEAASSWVDRGPNRELPAPDLEKAIGPDVIQVLTQRTGLSRDELLARLARELPAAVDRYTPDGRIPA